MLPADIPSCGYKAEHQDERDQTDEQKRESDGLTQVVLNKIATAARQDTLERIRNEIAGGGCCPIRDSRPGAALAIHGNTSLFGEGILHG
jgi:hypothetical protein